MNTTYEDYATPNMPKEIAEAVVNMMVKVGYVQKKGNNSFHNYKYAAIEDVLEKVQPALAECGLFIVQSERDHDIIAEGNLMKATYDFTLVAKTGARSEPVRHTGLASVRNSKGGYDDKALNKCHTAARKYFILGLFQIPTGLAEDPDDQEDRPALPPSTAPSRTAAPQSKTAASPAAEWAKNQTAVIRALASVQALTAWETKNEPTLAKLKDVDRKSFDDLELLLGDMRGKLTNFGIAAE